MINLIWITNTGCVRSSCSLFLMSISDYRSWFSTKFSTFLGFFNKNPPLFFLLNLGNMVKMAYKNRSRLGFYPRRVPSSGQNQKIPLDSCSPCRKTSWIPNFNRFGELLTTRRWVKSPKKVCFVSHFWLYSRGLGEKITADSCSAHRKILKMSKISSKIDFYSQISTF